MGREGFLYCADAVAGGMWEVGLGRCCGRAKTRVVVEIGCFLGTQGRARVCWKIAFVVGEIVNHQLSGECLAMK